MKVTEKEILEKGLGILGNVLNKYKIGYSKSNGNLYDAVLELPAFHKNIAIQVKSYFHPGHIDEFIRLSGNDNAENMLPMAITQRITEPSFEYCLNKEVNVLDLSGNIYLKISDNPICFIEKYREEKNSKPVSSGGSVFTARATRLVRALLSSFEKDWTQAELIKLTGLSSGYTSVEIRQMVEDGYIFVKDNIIRLKEPNQMLNDWLESYRYDRHKVQAYMIESKNYEQGLDKVAKSLKKSCVRFAFTGQSGAYIRANLNATDKYAAYVNEFPEDTDGLVRVQSGGNVRLYVPQDEGVFQFATDSGKYGQVVSDAQLYLDLRKMPGKDIRQSDDFRNVKLKFE